MTSMSKLWARLATSWPMRPKPITPSVLPYSSAPLNLARSQRPATSVACACGTLRNIASDSASVCSAAATEFDSGALATMIPRRVAAGMSTLSTPVPARPITFMLVARSISSGVILVAERIRIASYSGSLARNSSSDMSRPRSTSKRERSRSTPVSAIFSLTRTFIGRGTLALGPDTVGVRDDPVDAHRQRLDVVRLHRREHPDPQLVAAELAVRLGVHDAGGAQRLWHRRRVHVGARGHR